MELRSKIAHEIYSKIGGPLSDAEAAADAILALPEIREALAIVSATTPQDRRRKLAWAEQEGKDEG